MMFCLPTKCRYRLFSTVLQEKVGTIYDHPTTQYEQFIERYYGDTRVVASHGDVLQLFDKHTYTHNTIDVMFIFHFLQRRRKCVTLWGEGGFQLNVTMTLFWKKLFGDAP